MPKDAIERVKEIREQPGIDPEVQQQQVAVIADSYGEDTVLGRGGRARSGADPDDDGTILNRQDLLDSARALGVQVYDVAGALHLAKKDRMTRTELRQALREFKTREVE